MASDLRLRGVYVPLVTPFTEDDTVDLGALAALAADALDAGAAGRVGLAPAGEPPSLTEAGRAEAVSAVAGVCAARHATLIVGAGTYDTRTTIERHEALADVP